MSPHPYLSLVLGILAIRTTLVTGTVERTTEHRGVTFMGSPILILFIFNGHLGQKATRGVN